MKTRANIILSRPELHATKLGRAFKRKNSPSLTHLSLQTPSLQINKLIRGIRSTASYIAANKQIIDPYVCSQTLRHYCYQHRGGQRSWKNWKTFAFTTRPQQLAKSAQAANQTGRGVVPIPTTLGHGHLISLSCPIPL
ncbi:hypothetical protein TRVL_04481 [Trypanosoma vivax]|nr:hypothetical protein TRVL_04481 [Trypanosoma vivax]